MRKLASFSFVWLFTLAVLTGFSTSSARAAIERLALVIGNSTYANAPLRNPKHDAELMTKALEEVGFTVTQVMDADQKTMKRAYLEFSRQLRETEAVGVFYFAGHAIEVNGVNYLVPVGADMKHELEAEIEAIDVNHLLRTMERGRRGLNVVILDACRNNPFQGMFRSATRGLAHVNAPSGTFITYATAPGQVAMDGEGNNSPFTTALASAIKQPGLTLEGVIKSTARQVQRTTKGAQVPWWQSSYFGDFFFKKPLQAVVQSTVPQKPEKQLSTQQTATAQPVVQVEPAVSHEPQQPIKPAISQQPAKPVAPVVSQDPQQPTDPAPNRNLDPTVQLETQSPSASSNNDQLALLTPPSGSRVDEVLQIAPSHKCDELAAHPADADRVGPAVPYSKLLEQKVEAVKACVEATAQHPGVSRFEFQLGRALDASEEHTEAVNWYRKAAERNYTAAMYNLAVSYDEGEGIAKDQAKANFWYRKAADQGRVSAMWNLSINLDEGLGGPRNPADSAKYLLMAYKAGHEKAQKALEKNLEAWQAATRREVQRALRAAGYYSGPIDGNFNRSVTNALTAYAKGLEPSDQQPLVSENEPVDQNAPVHQCDQLAAHPADRDRASAAVSFETLESQTSQALEACRRAIAEHPDVSRFEFQLGRVLDAVQQHVEAVEWYQKAAERGYTAAMFNLAVSFDDGEGIEKDQALANHWYRKAAANGRTSAMWNLAINLDEGFGGPHDPKGAADYLLQAYKGGHEKAAKAFGKNLSAWQETTRREVEQLLRDRANYNGPVNGAFNDEARQAAADYAGDTSVTTSQNEPPVEQPSSLGGLHQCDRLAAHPSDKDRIASAVSYETLQGQVSDAIAACRRAVLENPGVSRFEFQLGRALDADGSYREAVKWYKPAAERGYTAAMYNLAVSYDEGEGIAQDQGLANFWYRKAADNGRSSAMWNLSINLDEGKGGPHDAAGAARYLIMAYLAGHEKAQKAFGKNLEAWQRSTRTQVQRQLQDSGYYNGPIDGNVTREVRDAMERYADAGGAQSETTSNYTEPSNDNTTAPSAPVDQYVGVHQCDRLAAHPADSERIVSAVSYDTLQRQVSAAISDCRRAISEYPGVSRFEFQLGRALDADGAHREAAQYYQQAADRGYTAAMYNLAVSYDEGEGVNQDQSRANYWYRKAAAKGRTSAMWNLSINLDEGKGERHNPEEAAKYLLMAYRSGHEKATKAFDKGLEAWRESTRKSIQILLRERGFYDGAIDGDIGRGTRRAARSYRDAG